MIEEYPEVVLSTYKKMRDNGELYTVIPKETTAALKNACLKVYDSRYTQDDADILSVFFNVDKMKCDFRKVISGVKSDYFKALYNHIRDETDTNERNSDLLAWLIDFKPRPSGAYYKNLRESIKSNNAGETTIEIETDDVQQNNGEVEIRIETKSQENLGTGSVPYIEEPATETIGTTEREKTHITNPTTPPVIIIPVKTNDIDVDGGSNIKPPLTPEDPIYIPRFSPRYITLSCIILLFVGSTSFVAWEITPTAVRMPKSGEECMYWNEDHYEPIDCKKTVNKARIIPLDLKTLTQQRKINIPDTLTSYSIGKVWYKGYGAGHEYFTAAGVYPPDTVRTLKKLSSGIFKNHLSYYRYLLTRLVWFLCAAIFISLCGIWASKLRKEVKMPDKSKEADNTEVKSATESVHDVNESSLVRTG